MAIFYTDSGSFFDVSVTSSLLVSGSTLLRGLTTAYQDNIVTIDTATGRLYYTASSAFGGGGGLTGGTANYIPRWLGASSQTTSSILQTGSLIVINGTGSSHPGNEEALLVNQISTSSYNLISGHSDTDSYSQLNIKNFSSGGYASSDVVATNNNGDESQGFINMGINSTAYTNTAAVGGAGDAYLYSTGENLFIGNGVTGKQLVLFNGGLDATANARVYVHDQGTVGFNTVETGSNPTNPPALFIKPPTSTTINMVTAEADYNSYVQIALTNKSGGVAASADLVAQNDLGTETDYYVDMGINSSGHSFDPTYTVGGPNDTYMLGVGNNHYIGSPKSKDIILFTGANFNGETGAKLVLKANNQHQVSGSLNVSGSVTAQSFIGSLSGTAATASYINPTFISASAAASGFGSGGGGSTVPYTGSAVISGSLAITGSLRVGVPGAGNPAIDSIAGTLSRGSIVSVDWISKTLQDASSAISIDWEGRVLNDGSSATSIDWEGRVLYTPNGEIALTYIDDTLAESNVYNKQVTRNSAHGEVFSSTLLNYSGQAIRAAIDVSATTGNVLYLETDGTWYNVDQTQDKSTKMLGIYLGSDRVLLDGDVVLEDATHIKTPGFGQPLYIFQSTSRLATAIPTSGYVRVLGHCYHQNTTTTDNWIVKFRPSNDWYQI